MVAAFLFRKDIERISNYLNAREKRREESKRKDEQELREAKLREEQELQQAKRWELLLMEHEQEAKRSEERQIQQSKQLELCRTEYEQRRKEEERQLNLITEQVDKTREELIPIIEQHYVVQPCFRCHEFSMRLLEVSPNGRSVHYQCLHCKKKLHAPAGTANAVKALSLWRTFLELCSRGEKLPGFHSMLSLNFVAPAAPLPFERTSRAPIPEAVRSEVWRRDSGKCVQCGSKQNLQFDHIIPVTRGGATSTANLQLLCQPCNGSKTNKI